MFDRPRNNDNVNFNRNFNVIDNVKSYKSANQVDAIVDRVMKKLNAGNESREWYCKIAWKLSESQINDSLETALKGNSPQKYFTWLCKRYM